MADVHDKATRSYNMSRIRSQNSKPELLVRKFLFANGFRYRLNVKTLPGKPDLVLKKYNTIIFIHGCFWHGHKNCKYFKLPSTNKSFWKNKIEGNAARDIRVTNELMNSGWNVITIWECKLKNKDIQEKTLNNILYLL